MVEQSVHSVQLALNGGTIIRVFRCVNVLRYLQQLIGFTVRFSVAGVVRVIVVKVQQKFVGERFETTGKVFYLCKPAKSNLYRSRHRVDRPTDGSRLRIVKVMPVVNIIGAMMMVANAWNHVGMR